MTVRPIDASRFGEILEQWKKDCLEDNDTQGADIISDVILQLDDMPTIAQPPITGDTSDGYHTFNELYHHRAVLFSVICNARPDIAWKSKKHHDGSMYDDMFIVGIDTPEGQATYHYDIEPYWGIFHVKELEFAPEWDGHTPDEAIRRIGTLTLPNEWVSVEERPPEFPNFLDHIMVITCNKNDYVIPMVRERTLVGYEWVERWLYPWNKIYDGPEITYWTSLPKPPGGGIKK